MSRFPPLVRMSVLSRRRVPEIRKGTGESGNGDWNSFTGGTSEKSTRHYAGRQGTVIIFTNYNLFIWNDAENKYLAGGGCRLFHLQGNERDACFPNFGANSRGPGGRGVAKELVKISRLLWLGLWWLVGKDMKLYIICFVDRSQIRNTSLPLRATTR